MAAGAALGFAQGVCLELVLLYGSHAVPGLEGVHTQVRVAQSLIGHLLVNIFQSVFGSLYFLGFEGYRKGGT